MRFALAAAALVFAPLAAQAPTTKPGAADPARVKAGTYKVDAAHTEILFEVDHLGFSTYWGIFHSATGTLTIDPKHLDAAKVEIVLPIDQLVTTTPELNKHLMAADFFNAAKFPTASFKSTRIAVSGTHARIAGDLTLHGVTKPILLDAAFTGAGVMPMLNVDTIGFSATTRIRRSDFGVSYGASVVSDVVPLRITVAFTRR